MLTPRSSALNQTPNKAPQPNTPAQVSEVLRGKQAAIDKNESSLEHKRRLVADSPEVKLWSCVERVWQACGAAAVQEEFETLDSQIGVDRMARGSSFEGDRAASVAALMMWGLKLNRGSVAMFTGAKCGRARVLGGWRVCDVCVTCV